jgi:hypothetical protein
MKIIQLTVIILITIAVFAFIKAKEKFNIIKGLPFADGEDVNLYHWASLAILLLTCWGYYRLTHKDDEDSPN